MKVWFEHEGQVHVANWDGLKVLPVLDKHGRQHLVRWGAGQDGDPTLMRGQWARYDYLSQEGAVWVPVPATKYEERVMHSGTRVVELDEPLAGALIRAPGATRVYLVDSDIPGPTLVDPCRYRAIMEKVRGAGARDLLWPIMRR